MRKIKLYDSRTNKTVTVNSSATTLGNIKDLEVNLSGQRYFTQVGNGGRSELIEANSPLPEDDFNLYILAKDSKGAGGDSLAAIKAQIETMEAQSESNEELGDLYHELAEDLQSAIETANRIVSHISSNCDSSNGKTMTSSEQSEVNSLKRLIGQ